MLSRKAKEAIKTGLAFVIVYAIALENSWLNPYWAGIAVAMISLQTAGESIHKGLNRMVGTIPGALAAIVIISLTAQSRWELLLLVSLWVFFTAYMSLRSRNNTYMWTVAGFVCLVLVTSGATTSEDLFEHVVFRVMETALGIGVYTLVTVFLWPQTNVGAIRKTSRELMQTQSAICRHGLEVMTAQVEVSAGREKRDELHRQELEQLTRLSQVLVAEGSENYEIKEVRPQWDRFLQLSTAVRESLDRWQTSMTELSRLDINRLLPDLVVAFDEFDRRFENIGVLLDGEAVTMQPDKVSLKFNRKAFGELSHFDQAALAVSRTELQKLESLTASLFYCALDLDGLGSSEAKSELLPEPLKTKPGTGLPIFDIDNLRSAAYVAVGTCVGFLVWVYFDPPGHSGWMFLTGTLALATIGMQQIPVIKFVKPLVVAAVVCLCIYVFVMPKLSTFYELGLLYFACMFCVRYFFVGLAQLMGIICIVNLLPVQNQQGYDFAAMANAAIYLLLIFLFLHGLSYMVSTPRPEKKVVALARRFFRSTEFIMSSLTHVSRGRRSLIHRWKFALYQHEMNALPGKIEAWSKVINPQKFSANQPDQVQLLVTTLQGLVYRMNYLIEAADTPRTDSRISQVHQGLESWRSAIESLFIQWSDNPGSKPVVDLEQRLEKKLGLLERKIDSIVESLDGRKLSEEDGEHFYRLLGAYRGISEAAVAYAGNTAGINWADWREEKF